MSDLSDLSQCPLSRESTEVVPVAWESARLHTPDQDEEQSDHPHRHAISVSEPDGPLQATMAPRPSMPVIARSMLTTLISEPQHEISHS